MRAELQDPEIHCDPFAGMARSTMRGNAVKREDLPSQRRFEHLRTRFSTRDVEHCTEKSIS